MTSARRGVALATAVALLTWCGSIPAAAASATGQPPIAVLLDGLPVEFDVPPRLENGRTLVPFRLLAEALGCTVGWDEASRRVHVVNPHNGRTVDLWIDRTDALVNGQPSTLDVPPKVLEGRTLVPLRFFGESLGAGVAWDETTSTVSVTSPRRAMEVLGYYALGSSESSSWTEMFGRSFPGARVGNTDVISEVACGWFVLDPASGGLILNDAYSGQERPDNWHDVLDTCALFGVSADMMVHWATAVGGVTDPAVYAFLADPDATRRAVEEIAAYAEDYRGVNLDIEGLGQRQAGDELTQTREGFVRFVTSLVRELHARGRSLSLSLHPLNSWYPGYDWGALGAVVDRIVIMAYGYGPRGKPEPLDKVGEAVDRAVQAVDRSRLLLGLLAESETPASAAVKVGLAKRHGLAGIALWRLGKVGAERMGAIRQAACRPPAVALCLDDADRATAPGGLCPIDTTAAPPLLVRGTPYVPLLPLFAGLRIEVKEDLDAGRATVGPGPQAPVVTAQAEDTGTGPPDEGPGPLVINGAFYVPVDTAVDLVRSYTPPDASFRVEATWDPSAMRLVVTKVPQR